MIERNVALNELGGTVEVLRAALGAAAGTLELHSERGGVGNAAATSGITAAEMLRHDAAGGQTHREVVEVTTLDDVLAGDDRPVSLVKMDVEGFEFDVLSGATGTISRHRPVLYTEMNRQWLASRGVPDGALDDWITANGYRCFEVTSQRLGRWSDRRRRGVRRRRPDAPVVAFWRASAPESGALALRIRRVGASALRNDVVVRGRYDPRVRVSAHGPPANLSIPEERPGMSMTEAERLELYELAKRQVGDRFAELMIKAVPADPERLATKDDLAVLGGDLRTEMADLRTDLRTEMADLRTDLRTEMADLRTDLRTEMADLRTEMADLRADLRTEMADLRTDLRTEIADLRTELKTEMRDVTSQQTRTMTIGLVGSVTALAITQLVLGVVG